MSHPSTSLAPHLFRIVITCMVSVLAACGGSNSSGNAADADPRLATLVAEVDAFMQPYLASNGITAATIAVARNGQVVAERAYGHKDLARTQVLTADALLTGASIVKPVTAAAIQLLASRGQVGLSDRVFCATGSRGPGNACWVPASWVSASDLRIRDITVQHLIEHRGGWLRDAMNCTAYVDAPGPMKQVLRDSGLPCDPLQHDSLVMTGLGLQSPPTLAQTVQYFMRSGLDFAPGTTPVSGDRYSNFGYMLLGYIINQATGQSYNQFVRSEVLAPLGVAAHDFKDSASLLADADPREPHYVTNQRSPSLYPPLFSRVSVRDGAIAAPNWVSTATTMMTARAMALFAQSRRIDTDASSMDGPSNGVPLNGATHSAYHRGDLPGTAAVVRQLSSGLSYAVLMNKNDRFEGTGQRVDYPTDVRLGIDAALVRAGF